MVRISECAISGTLVGFLPFDKNLFAKLSSTARQKSSTQQYSSVISFFMGNLLLLLKYSSLPCSPLLSSTFIYFLIHNWGYQRYGSYIFKSSFFRRAILSWFNCAQYPHKNIEFVLDKYFGEDILKNTLSNVLLTSYDIYNNCPFFFKSWKEGNIKLKDALRAATAAPTYFIPKHLKINQINRVLVDGGVFANNPAACAYASGKRLFPNDDILLLSIGTGRTDRSIEYANSKRFGKIEWIKPLLNVMFASSLDAVNYQLDQVIGSRYLRIQSQLKIASPDMDNITSKNIKSLQQEANAMIEDNQKLIDKLCDFISYTNSHY